MFGVDQGAHTAACLSRRNCLQSNVGLQCAVVTVELHEPTTRDTALQKNVDWQNTRRKVLNLQIHVTT